MNFNPEWITAIATSILALFTFIAVLVALFKEEFLYHFKKPQIEIIIGDQKSPFVVYSGDNIYHRVKVKNSGKTLAKNCHLRLIVVYPYGDSNPIISEPATLKWAGSPLDSRYLIETGDTPYPTFREKRDIPPFDGWELCDIIRTTRKGRDIIFNSSQQENRPIEKKNQDYLVYLNILGDNFKPKVFSFIVKNNLDWKKIKIEYRKN